jgi:hypothetical protein
MTVQFPLAHHDYFAKSNFNIVFSKNAKLNVFFFISLDLSMINHPHLEKSENYSLSIDDPSLITHLSWSRIFSLIILIIISSFMIIYLCIQFKLFN